MRREEEKEEGEKDEDEEDKGHVGERGQGRCGGDEDEDEIVKEGREGIIRR